PSGCASTSGEAAFGRRCRSASGECPVAVAVRRALDHAPKLGPRRCGLRLVLLPEPLREPVGRLFDEPPSLAFMARHDAPVVLGTANYDCRVGPALDSQGEFFLRRLLG